MSEVLALMGRVLIDGTDREPLRNPVVVINGGRIDDVRGDGKVPSGARLVDVSDCALMPGMMDLHLHIAAPNAQDYENTDLAHITRSPADTLLDSANNCRRLIEAGFTTIRDLDWIIPGGRNFVEERAALRDAIAAEKVLGPRIVVGGMAHITGSHFDRIMPRNLERDPNYLADGPWEMRRLTRLNFRNGADLIKTCISGGLGTFDCSENSLARNIHIDELKAMVDEAHAFRRPVAAHCHTPDSVRMAIEAGVDTVEHCVLTDDDAVSRLATSGKYVIPTLAIREGSVIERKRARGIPDFVIQMFIEKREVCFETFRRYFKAGVRFAMGTDTHVDPPFGENAREIQIYVELGMTPQRAIQTATRNAADALGLLEQLGTVEKGKEADILAIAGNPLDDIGILRNTDAMRLVLKRGRILVDRRPQ